MQIDISDLSPQITTKGDFEKEISKANSRLPYNAELIADYIMALCSDYKKFGDSDEGFFKGALVEATLEGMPVICDHMDKCEQDRSNIVAAYTAANSRMQEQSGRFKFWQGVAFGLACITVVYCVIRMVVWLAPHGEELKIWLDSAL